MFRAWVLLDLRLQDPHDDAATRKESHRLRLGEAARYQDSFVDCQDVQVLNARSVVIRRLYMNCCLEGEKGT